MSGINFTELTRSEQAWAKNTSRRIGNNLFNHKAKTTRKSDVEQICNCLYEILLALKKNEPAFDIEILNLPQVKYQFFPVSKNIHHKPEKSLIYENDFKHQPNFYELFYKYCTKRSIIGERRINLLTIKDQKWKKKLQITLTNIYNGIVKETNPLHQKFDKEKYDKLTAIKKANKEQNFLSYKKWNYRSNSKLELPLIFNNIEYNLLAYSKIETDKYGQPYKIVCPVVNSEIFTLFAEDVNKENKSLHQWLIQHIESLKNQIILADIDAKIEGQNNTGNYIGINLSGCRIINLHLHDIDCRNMILRDCDILNMNLNRCQYEGIDLRGAYINKLTFDSNNKAKTFLKQEKSEQDHYAEYKEKKNGIYVSIANFTQAYNNNLIDDTLYNTLKNRILIDPFYVKGTEYNDLNQDKVFIQAKKQDLDNYIEEINQLQVIQNIKKGIKKNIDWVRDKIPAFTEFMTVRYNQGKNSHNIYVNLTDQDLTSFNFIGGNYKNVNFAGCKILNASYANFCGSCLEGVIAKNANFSYSHFIHTNMQYISAEGANFAHANMSEANLERASLKNIKGQFIAIRANMRFACCAEATINHSNLRLIEAEGIDFTNVEAKYCQMIGAKMRRANLNKGKFLHSDFSRAILNEAIGELANFSNSIMKDIVAENTYFPNTNMQEVEAEGANFKGSNFTKANMNKMQSKNMIIDFAILDKAEIYQSDFEDASMKSVNAIETNFVETYLKNANFERADLTGATFNKANLGQTNFIDADLTNCDIKGAYFKYIKYDEYTDLLGLKNINSAHIEKEFYNTFKEQHSKTYPLDHLREEIVKGYNKIRNFSLNIIQGLVEIIKYNIAYSLSGTIFGVVMSAGMIIAPNMPGTLFPTCISAAMLGCIIGLDAVAIRSYLNELMNSKEIPIKLDSEYVTEQTIATMQKNKINSQESIPKNDDLNPQLDQIKESLLDINKNFSNFPEIHELLKVRMMTKNEMEKV